MGRGDKPYGKYLQVEEYAYRHTLENNHVLLHFVSAEVPPCRSESAIRPVKELANCCTPKRIREALGLVKIGPEGIVCGHVRPHSYHPILPPGGELAGIHIAGRSASADTRIGR